MIDGEALRQAEAICQTLREDDDGVRRDASLLSISLEPLDSLDQVLPKAPGVVQLKQVPDLRHQVEDWVGRCDQRVGAADNIGKVKLPVMLVVER